VAKLLQPRRSAGIEPSGVKAERKINKQKPATNIVPTLDGGMNV
jgi:hypothetical protein